MRQGWLYSFMHWFQSYLGFFLIYHCHIHSDFGGCCVFVLGFFWLSREITLLPSVWALWSLIAQTQGSDLSWFVLFAMQMLLASASFYLYPLFNGKNFANKLTDFAKQQGSKQTVTALSSTLSSFWFESNLKQTYKTLKFPQYSDNNKPKPRQQAN